MNENDFDQENENTQEVEASELDTLRARADLMGIEYRHNTGVSKLRKLVEAKLEPVEEVAENVGLTKSQRVAKLRKEALALVRVRITCMNPNKKNIEGEFFSTGSAALGTFKKYVPFDAPDGWHVPTIIYNMLKERKCSVFYSHTASNGKKSRKSKLVPEFSIELLPQLTSEELRNLARQQALVNDE
jgi:hypothetical protein